MAAKARIEDRFKPRRGRPPKKAQPAPPPLAAPVDLKPGEVEQSNCKARSDHKALEQSGGRCSLCGFPGEWTGAKPPAPRVTERMQPSQGLAAAIDHIGLLLNLIATKNANDVPMPGVCLICDEQNEHAGPAKCECPCHAARAFYEAQTAPFI